jgi:ribosomal protein S18 acetylase RimI-like enzyme
MHSDRAMEIRKSQEMDRDSLVSLWTEVFPDDPPHNEPSSVIDAKLAVDDLIFVADWNDKIVGACIAGYDGHRGWLYAVGVIDEYRRTRVGVELVTLAIRSLKEICCLKVNLQIRSTNTQVAAFYKSLGFVVEDRLSMGLLVE